VPHLEVHQSTQTLRLNLVDMCKVSRRCVDYSIEALKVDNPDLIAGVRDRVCEIDLLHSDVTGIAQDLLLNEQLPLGPYLRFVLSSMRIADALRSIHQSSVEIASNIVRFLGNNGDLALTNLSGLGDSTGKLVELCADSFIDEAIEPAQMVLYTDRFDRDFVINFYEWYRSIDAGDLAQAHYVLAITRHLSHIVQQAREIADAIVFWLEDLDERPGPETGEIDLVNHLNPKSIRSIAAAISGWSARSSIPVKALRVTLPERTVDRCWLLRSTDISLVQYQTGPRDHQFSLDDY